MVRGSHRFGAALSERVKQLFVAEPVYAVMLGACFVALYCLARSLSWGLLQDAPLMHYIAAQILRGATPYRDIFDMNMPGTYLVHMVVQVVFGPSDLAWRLFDLIWVVATCLAVFRYARPLHAPAAALAGLLVFLFHLSSGAVGMGQRDFLMCLLLVLSLHLAARRVEGGGVGSLVGAGLLLGAAATIKPQAVLLLCLTMPLIAAWLWRGRQPLGRIVAELAAMAIGAALPVVAVGLWLWLSGGLAAFDAMLTGFLLPVYGQLKQLPPAKLLLVIVLQALSATYFVLALPLIRGFDSLKQARGQLLALGVVYGLTHVFTQGKGWPYHLYPLNVFLITAVALVCGGALGRTRQRRLALAICIAITAAMSFTAARTANEDWSLASRKPLVLPLVRELRGMGLQPNDTVQVLDSVDGGVQALLLTGVRQPTRFLYFDHLNYLPAHPAVQALRAQFIDELETGRPRAIVVIDNQAFLPAVQAQIASFPALENLLDTAYRPGSHYTDPTGQYSYTVYLPRPGATSGTEAP